MTVASVITRSDSHDAASTRRAARSGFSDRLLGLALMVLIPTLFWTGLVAVMAPVLGYQPTLAQLAQFGTAVGLFLACICCVLTARSSD